MKDYSLLDHTADIGIRIKGKDYSEIFLKASQAMFDVIAQPLPGSRRKKRQTFAVEVQANHYDELLLNWLSELISLSDAKGVIFTDFQVKKLTANELKAAAVGYSKDNFSMEREIKAVTYHHLKIERKGRQYQAEIIFDV